MHSMNNLAGIDLNLLVVLDALLAERHVSRAAIRLNKSQPTVSHALGRLRHLLDDPLLVRHGGALQPTMRALEIAPRLAEALERMHDLLAPSGFHPATARRSFRLAMSDYGATVVLPRLLPLLRRRAPGIDLQVSQAGREAMAAQVMDGEVDIAIGVFHALDKAFRRQRLFEEDYACLADASLLGKAAGMDIGAYLQRPHALVALRADVESEIDVALAAAGHKRRIALVLPHWGVAPGLIAGTDLVLTIARRLHPAVPAASGLAAFEPPFAIPSFAFQQIWHRRRDGDAAHQWLRETIAGLFESRQRLP